MDDAQPLMFTTRKQQTLAGSVQVEGFGYWSGRDIRVEFRPAEVGSGRVFIREDLPGQPRIPARVEHRVETPRRTTLQCGEARVEMVEHILAALAGLQIDNCEIAVNETEMPGCDGSAIPFVEAFDSVGLVTQEAPQPQRVVPELLRLGSEETWIEAAPPTGERTLLRYHLDYGRSSFIGRQTVELVLTPESFRAELAPCRTFLLQAEAEWARSQGVGVRTSYRDLLVIGEHGPIDNELRLEGECVRHKLLDLVGDLALAGSDLIGRFRASRSGHRLNAELLRALLGQTEAPETRRRCA